MSKHLPVNLSSTQPALSRIFATLALAALTVPLLATGSSNPWEQMDWQHWSRKDVDAVLYHSPWVSACCQPPVGDGSPPLTFAAIVSSLVVRQALARRMQLDRHYDTMNPTNQQQIDQQIAGCLRQKFDDQIVLTTMFVPMAGETPAQWGGNDPNKFYGNKILRDEYKKDLSRSIYLVTSDGRNIFADPSAKTGDAVAQSCGGVATVLDTFPKDVYGPIHELSFPRFVDGQPTIKPDDKVIRFRLNYSEGQQIFTIDKLTYQGKQDF
jgi:hypothetical protein